MMIKTELITYDADARSRNGEIPIAECREVVRCRDCEYSMFDKECSRIDPWVDETWFAIEPDGFCAWGERRDDGNDR